MRIAVATSNGQRVDLHFGKTSEFRVYDVTPKGMVLQEKRAVAPYAGEPGHDFNALGLEKIARSLSDCKKIVVSRIGQIPFQKLEEKGFEILEFEGPLTSIPSLED